MEDINNNILRLFDNMFPFMCIKSKQAHVLLYTQITLVHTPF